MIKKNIFITLFLTFILSFCFLSFVDAASLRDKLDNIDGDNVNIRTIVQSGGMATDKNLPTLFSSVIKIILGIFAVITLIFIIQSGIKWFSAKGMPDKIQESRKVLSASIIGMIIITTAYASTDFIINQITLINPSNQYSGDIGNENDNCNPVCNTSISYDGVNVANGCLSNSASSSITYSLVDERCPGSKSSKSWDCVCGTYESVSCYVCNE